MQKSSPKYQQNQFGNVQKGQRFITLNDERLSTFQDHKKYTES